MEIRPDETLSVTDIQRRAKEVFERIESGQQDQFIVLRNNGIAAGFLPVKRYEALIDELEDLRIDAIAAERATTFDPAKAITHESAGTDPTGRKSRHAPTGHERPRRAMR